MGVGVVGFIGVVLYIVNRFRQRKSQMRHQNQNNQDDQRSIGSIGYIGGNLGYMGSMTMEYPYEQNSHFQLWKPFFPRGEAPPPYEEAISMAQTESLNTQAAAGACTVSVATSTHRTLPMNVCNSATTDTDLSLPVNGNPITSNTTNLINININNAGNITAVATGENHLIQSNGSYLSATPTNTLPRHANTSGINAAIVESDLASRGAIAFNPAITNCSNSDLTSSSMRDIPCTLQNCDLNTSCSLIRSTSSLSSTGGTIIGATGCYSAPSTMKMNQQNQTSNQSLAQILANNQSSQNLYEHWNSIDCLGTGTVTQAILPPPLFDTNCTSTNYNQCYEIQNHPGNYCTLSAIEVPKMPSRDSSRRLHRTIPKHFTMSSPSSSAILTSGNDVITSQSGGGNLGRTNSGDNKKPSCQCPVQHVPMTYMQFSSAQVAQMPPPQTPQITEIQTQPLPQQQPIQIQQRQHQHSIYMSTSVGGGSSSSGSKKNNVIKSTTYPSAMNVQNVSASKIQTITNSELLGIGSDVLQTTAADINASGLIASGSGTLRRSHKSSSSSSNNPNNNLAMPTTPNKKSIATISVASPRSPSSSSASAQHGYFAPSKMDSTKPQQIHSILKNKNQQQQPNCHINVISVNSDGCIESSNNPILPPKLYKNNNGKYSITPVNSGSSMTPSGSKQIHTITRPNELTTSSSQFTLLSINGAQKQQQQYQQQSPQYQPTQLRTNIQGTLYNTTTTSTKTLPRGSSSSSSHGCESNSEGKSSRTNYSGSSQQQQAQRESQSTSNYSTNTLPKNQHQQQPASQQIYGKVTNPSRSVLNDVVNKVPSVIMLPLPQQQQHSQSNGGNQMKSMLKASSSRDNLCDNGGCGVSTEGGCIGISSTSLREGGGSSSGGNACHSQNSTLKRNKSKKEVVNANEKVISSKNSSSNQHSGCTSSSSKCIEKPLPVLTTTTNCTNPKEHFLPSEMSLDDDYLSECENCKTAGTGSRYYLDDEELDEPLQETMTLQRKLMNENDENDQQSYYRVSSTLPTNTNKKAPVIKNREPWFTTIPASSSSDEETLAE